MGSITRVSFSSQIRFLLYHHQYHYLKNTDLIFHLRTAAGICLLKYFIHRSGVSFELLIGRKFGTGFSRIYQIFNDTQVLTPILFKSRV